MPMIRAIYENGVFRPLEPEDFPEGSRIALERLTVVKLPEGVSRAEAEAMLRAQDLAFSWEVKDQRADSDGRSNEHQP